MLGSPGADPGHAGKVAVLDMEHTKDDVSVELILKFGLSTANL